MEVPCAYGHAPTGLMYTSKCAYVSWAKGARNRDSELCHWRTTHVTCMSPDTQPWSNIPTGPQGDDGFVCCSHEVTIKKPNSRANKTKLLVSIEQASCPGNYLIAQASNLTSYPKNDYLMGRSTLIDLILGPFCTPVWHAIVPLYFSLKAKKKWSPIISINARSWCDWNIVSFPVFHPICWYPQQSC